MSSAWGLHLRGVTMPFSPGSHNKTRPPSTTAPTRKKDSNFVLATSRFGGFRSLPPPANVSPSFKGLTPFLSLLADRLSSPSPSFFLILSTYKFYFMMAEMNTMMSTSLYSLVSPLHLRIYIHITLKTWQCIKYNSGPWQPRKIFFVIYSVIYI